LLHLFFLQSSPPHPDPHSFPTRRSSDLKTRIITAAGIVKSVCGLKRSICSRAAVGGAQGKNPLFVRCQQFPKSLTPALEDASERSEEHTSELQSPYDLVCRLLLEKKK